MLLDPPYNVSLDHNGEPGQLQVSWKCDAPKFLEDDMMFTIRYSSTSLGQKIEEVLGDVFVVLNATPSSEGFTVERQHWLQRREE